MTILEPKLLHELLYCFESQGTLVWKRRASKWFSSESYCDRWNEKYAGTQAFTCVSEGYHVGAIKGIKYKAHRVIWAMHYGQWPTGQIDHINGDKSDNRIENLRDVTNRENCRNKRLFKANTSGHVGVWLKKETGKWVAEITVNYKTIPLGTFATKEGAIARREQAELEHGFHPTHGRAA